MTRRPRPWVATAGATCDASLAKDLALRLARLCEEGFVCSQPVQASAWRARRPPQVAFSRLQQPSSLAGKLTAVARVEASQAWSFAWFSSSPPLVRWSPPRASSLATPMVEASTATAVSRMLPCTFAASGHCMPFWLPRVPFCFDERLPSIFSHLECAVRFLSLSPVGRVRAWQRVFPAQLRFHEVAYAKPLMKKCAQRTKMPTLTLILTTTPWST
mmetsp:Transcript_13830/g.36753  ORF Transcript_13830/g.36753 Transcript_13830/m.36753 type:complete len:216 (-) Transcript_13830:39-686(-)